MITDFKDLRESKEFLNLLLDNINSAVLIADENLRIHQFNNSFLNLFDKAYESLTENFFGPATGCVNAVKEKKPCGETSQCKHCVLRQSLPEMLLEEVPVNRKRLERIFYIDGVPTQKYLEFSARSIDFQGQKMILVIIYDITLIEQKKIDLQNKQEQIDLDLEAAGEIQKCLLPNQTPVISKIKTTWRFEPCLEVGGDIFQLYSNPN